MEEQELKKLMDDLDNTEVHLSNIQSDKETLKQTQIPLDIQVKLEEIDLEFADQIESLGKQIKKKKELLQKELLKFGKPVKSKFYEYRFEPGEPEWDTSFLDGYALNHPEILHWRNEGKPTTRLMKIKQ
jgi:hypothetical protein